MPTKRVIRGLTKESISEREEFPWSGNFFLLSKMFFIMSFPLPKPCNVIPLIVLKKAKINIRLRLKFSDNLTMQDLLEGLKQKKIS